MVCPSFKNIENRTDGFMRSRPLVVDLEIWTFAASLALIEGAVYIYGSLALSQELKIAVSVVRFRPWAPLNQILSKN